MATEEPPPTPAATATTTATAAAESTGNSEELKKEDANHNDVDFLQAKCSLLTNQLAFLRSQQKQKKEQRKKEKGEIVSTFKSMKGYIDHLETENKHFKALAVSAAGSLHTSSSSSPRGIGSRISTLAEDDSDVALLQQRVAALELENQALQHRERELRNKCQNLTDQCSRLTEEVSKGKDTEAQLRDQVEKYEQVVDRVPSLHQHSRLHKNVSMSVMADASDDASSRAAIDESVGYGVGDDDIKEDLFGKMVDHTPITPLNKGAAGRNKGTGSVVSFNVQEDDTVFGVTDRAELASIQDLDEEDEEDDDDDDGGGGEEWAGSVAADNISLRLDIIDEKNLIDKVPSVLKTGKARGGRGHRKTGSSVAVVPDVSIISGGRDDNTVGDDDNLFGKMVDHTPDLSAAYPLKKTGSSVSFRDNLEDDTVLGVTEKLEIESVARQDDDVSSHGMATVDDDETGTRDGMSIAGISLKLNVVEEKNLVDKVPARRNRNKQQKDASVVAIADNYSTSSPMNDDAITDAAGRNFGPIVDQLPNLGATMSTKSAATSVVTQNSLFTDLNDNYDHDADTLGPASTIGDSDWDSSHHQSSSIPESKHMVDHVPKRGAKRPTDLSVRVFADNNDNTSQVDTIAEEEEMEFGPIVDQTPFSAARSVISTRSTVSVAGSTMAVGGDATQDDDMETVQDTMMDTGTTASIQEDLEEDDNVVDHVPSRRKMRTIQVDESVRVIVDANENMSQVDTIAEDAILDDFGPIVDHTPAQQQEQHGGEPSSGARSVAASTAAVGDDARTEADDLESTALHTTVTSDLAMGMSESERFVPLAGEDDEKHMVDHVPKDDNRPTMGGSVRVVVDQAENLSQVDTVAEEERVAFGPIVDHTPGFRSRSASRSIGASMISVGSRDSDSTSIQDNTTVGFGIGGSVTGGEDIGTLDDNTAQGYTPSAVDDKKLVDHVPQSSFPKPVDVSVAVQADPLDAVFEVDDETSTGNVRTDRYGPIVDQTPVVRASSAPSVATSMLTTTSDNAVDVRTDDGTWFSASTDKDETIGEVSLTNSGDPDQPRRESTLEEDEEEHSEELKGSGTSSKETSSGILVETVNSRDSEDDEEAFVHVSKADSKVGGSASVASDGDGGYNLQEMQSYAEELAARATESKNNPFDIEANAQPPPEKAVNSDVKDYIAKLASGTKDPATENSPEKQKYDEVKNFVTDLANETDSIESSTGGHSSQEMTKYIADLASFTGIQDGAKAETAEESSSDPHMAETPRSKGDASETDARNEILDEIGTSKKQSVFGKIFRGKKQKGKQDSKKDGTWA